MKTCKHCKEQIAIDATKCPKCQAHQNWYHNPQLLAIIPMILFLPFLIYMIYNRHERVHFEDYREKVTIKKLSQDTLTIKDKKMINILVEVENNSDQKWENAVYEVQYLSPSGKLLNVERSSDYKFIINANKKAISSIKIPIYEEYQDVIFDLKLSELKQDRF